VIGSSSRGVIANLPKSSVKPIYVKRPLEVMKREVSGVLENNKDPFGVIYCTELFTCESSKSLTYDMDEGSGKAMISFIEVYICGFVLCSVLDTGANRSIISEDCANRMQIPMTYCKGRSLVGIGGSRNVIGVAMPCFTLANGLTYKKTMLVLKNSPVPMILENDFIAAAGLSINPSKCLAMDPFNNVIPSTGLRDKTHRMDW
jgi:hypothetical protein